MRICPGAWRTCSRSYAASDPLQNGQLSPNGAPAGPCLPVAYGASPLSQVRPLPPFLPDPYVVVLQGWRKGLINTIGPRRQPFRTGDHAAFTSTPPFPKRIWIKAKAMVPWQANQMGHCHWIKAMYAGPSDMPAVDDRKGVISEIPLCPLLDSGSSSRIAGIAEYIRMREDKDNDSAAIAGVFELDDDSDYVDKA
ncbi:hypothetical protein JCM3770_005186 [Rhodotorula araucariae]